MASESELALQQQVEQLTTMLEISRNLNSTLDLGQLLRAIVGSAVKLIDCDDSSILLIDPQNGDQLHFKVSAGLESESIQSIAVPMDASVAGWVVRHDQEAIIDDVSEDPRFFKRVDKVTGFPTRSILGVPMRFQGRVIGVLEALNKKDGRFTPTDVERLSILSAQAAVAVENARMFSELQRAYQELSELDRLKSEFITTTSHELRTPLTAIKGFMQLIISGMLPTIQQASALQTISRHVDTIIHLVNDMFFVQEISAVEFKYAPVNLGGLVLAEINEVQSRAESAGIRLIPQIPNDSPPVWGDAHHLRKMFHNLLDNAIKFSPDGGDVTVTLRAQDRTVQLEISDPGVGISPEHLDKIFERFYRIERAGGKLFGGLGLGLAITKQIVQAHKGKVSVTSEPGRGSTFTVILPTLECQT